MERLASLSDEYRADLIDANCENAAGGFGVTPKIAEEMPEKGINSVRIRNHISGQEGDNGLSQQGAEAAEACKLS